MSPYGLTSAKPAGWAPRLRHAAVHGLGFLVLLPSLLTLACIAALFSAPGLFSDGTPTGHAYALAFVLAAVALAVALIRHGKRTRRSGARVAVGLTAGLLVTVLFLVLLGVGAAWLLYSLMTVGWCNPRC
ncbi:MAG: hypothetical protein H7Y33_19630 [Cytophagales bacterium]|nr:hypothetical protein [Rhizobacter sp.]